MGQPLGPVLVGMRGSGKTTVAPLVAARLELEWVDSDAELEAREGASIEALLALGEPEFRVREARVLEELLDRPAIVLATGGGAVLHRSVRERCRSRFTVWLDAPPPVLAARIAGGERPPLTPLPPAEEVRHLHVERKPWYRQASHLRIDVSQFPPDAVAERIAEAWIRAQSQAG